MKRVEDKVIEIEEYLEELYEIIPETFEEYKQDFKSKAACERYFEKIICAIIDLSFLIIKLRKLKTPETDKESFDVLAKSNIITEALSSRLQDAKSMRNIIAHEYGRVDNRIVFDSITEQLSEDVQEFIKQISKII